MNYNKENKSKKKRKIWVVLCVILCIITVFCIWQNNSLTVSSYVYSTDEIGSDLSGYRIVQISDLHNKRFGKNQRRLLSEIEKCNPDMIVITGDLIDSNRTDIEIAMEFVDGAVKIAPVYYVTGNHEKWLSENEKQKLMERLEEVGAVVLDNEKVEITVGHDKMILLGLDDAHLMDDTLKRLAVGTENTFTVLLAHEPQNLSYYSEENIDLVLAGHAHGGQFRIPFLGGVVAPDQGFFPTYTAGLYHDKSTSMIVSRGLGNSVIPIRIFNRPDIVCVEIQHN